MGKQAARAAASGKMGNQAVHRETKHVRHVGDAVVVFDERCVTPLFVAEGIRVSPTTPLSAKPRQNQVATRQLLVGDEHFWVPPEEDRWRKGMLVRRVWNCKARVIVRNM